LTTPQDAARRASYSREGMWDWRRVADALCVAWSVPGDQRTHEHSEIMSWPTAFIAMVRVRQARPFKSRAKTEEARRRAEEAAAKRAHDRAVETAFHLRLCVHIRSQVVARKGFYTTEQLLAGSKRKMSRATFERCWRQGCALIAEALNRERAREDERMAA
jgi:hypothetical protein